RAAKKRARVKTDPELKPDQLHKLIDEFRAIYKKHTREEFPEDPLEQLRGAINAVFASWNTPRAVAYRRVEKIPDDLGTAEKLQRHYRDMQDLEFTVERKKLWMLQTRNAKRTGEAAVNVAVDMVSEGLISKEDAVARVEPRQLEQLLHPRVDPNAKAKTIGKGVPASPGAATGQAVFDADTAEDWGKQGKSVILVRIETNPNDVHGMIEARGILTST